MRTPLVIMALWLAACSPADDKGLDEARQRWDEQAVRSYTFTWRESCFCEVDWSRPVRITVEAGQIADAVFDDDRQPVGEQRRRFLTTVDGLFDKIQRAVDDDDYFTVAFDPTWGYPTSMFIDHERRTADEEFTLEVPDFAPVAR